MFVSLSPTYAVRNEATASFLIRVNKIINPKRSDFSAFCIPPFMGYILSHIGDYEYEVAVKAISESLHVSSVAIDRFVQQILNNEEKKEFKITEQLSVILPSHLLTRSDSKTIQNIFEDEKFTGVGDYIIKRPEAPLSANLMVTTYCTTDCVYCYANRTLSPCLKTEKLLSVIKELHDIGTINLTLTGGDIFAHPDWLAILKGVREYGYKPFLSTKTPLDYEKVKCLKDLGYEEIQFSLDSVDNDDLGKLVKAKRHYLDNVSNFLKICSGLSLNVLVRSVLTSINSSKEKIASLYGYLAGYDCVKEWTMTPAFFSKYKESVYKSIEVSNENLKEIYEYIQTLNSPFKIGFSKINENGYILKKYDNVEDYVCHNQICMANTTCISILANGECSVCEMLYDNPEYILGNLSDSTIKDIWNSEKALNLYEMPQSQFPKDSPCKKCEVFDKCRNTFGKRVCYLDIAKSGRQKWEPDPRCPRSADVNMIL